MNTIKKISTTLLLSALCIIPAAYAQGPGFEEDVVDTPIDGGTTLIALTIVGYGVKKLKDLKQKS